MDVALGNLRDRLFASGDALAVDGSSGAAIVPRERLVSRHVDVPGLTDGGFVAMQALGAIVGEALRWDQSYWIARIGVKDQRCFRKEQARAKTLGRLVHLFRLGIGSFVKGVDGSRRGQALQSQLMLPWLLHRWCWAENQGSSPRDSSVVCLRTWLTHSLIGLRAVRGPMSFTTFFDGGLHTFRIDFEHATIEHWAGILERVPSVQEQWRKFMQGDSVFARLRPEATGDAACILLSRMGHRFWKYTEATPSWEYEVVCFLNRALAIGVESLILFTNVAVGARDASFKIMRGRKRRLAFTRPTIEAAVRRARAIGGSSNTVIKMYTGERGLDARITYSLVTVYRSKCQQLFRGCRAVSVAWDPGTYSNVSWNMGLMAATGEQCFACDLVPKAPPTPPFPTSPTRLVTHTSNHLVFSMFDVGCVFGRGDLRVGLGFLGGLRVSLPSRPK